MNWRPTNLMFMGFKNTIKDFWRKASDTVNNILPPKRAVEAIKLGGYTLNNYPERSNYFFSPGLGLPKPFNPHILRDFGLTPWASMIKNTIKEEFVSLEWDIVPLDEDKELSSKEERERDFIRDFFERPNKDDTYNSMIRKLLPDIHDLDGGVVVKVFSTDSFSDPREFVITTNEYSENNGKGKSLTNGELIKKSFRIKHKGLTYTGTEEKEVRKDDSAELLSLYVADGATFYKQTDIYGRLFDDRPTYFQYSTYQGKYSPRPFYNREVVYFEMNPVTFSCYGVSPIANSIRVIELLQNATAYNADAYREGVLPATLLRLVGMQKEELKGFIDAWKKEFKGKNKRLAFTNTDGKVENLSPNAKEMEWLEGQKFYMKLLMAQFKVTQGELGFTDELNKHSSEAQLKINVKKALKPLVDLFEQRWNNFVMPELDKAGLFRFKYKLDDDDNNEQRDAERADVQAKILTINEVRNARGLEPVEWGEEPMNPVSMIGSPFNEQPMTQKEQLKESKSFSEQSSHSYEGFLDDYYERVKQAVLTEVPSLIDLKKSDGLRKAWKDFFSKLITLLDPDLKLFNKLRKVIKQTFNKGLEQGETKVGAQIGFQDSFNTVIDTLTNEQLNGYVLPDGKQWYGLKGVNQELQSRIHDEVLKGLKAAEGIKELKDRITKVFSEASDVRAERIARTESSRMITQGELTAYSNLGVKKKEWLSQLDSRTSDICNRLHRQVVGLDEPFTDPETGKQYWGPPAHPNCRSDLMPVGD